MYTSNIDPQLTKKEFYAQLLTQVKSIIQGERNWVTNLANVGSILFHAMNSMDIFQAKRVNWVGFYLMDKSDKELLKLGPFQGKVACTRIRYGKGVCGTAAATRLVQIVPDVHKFPGHIACDSESLSEIVVPIVTPTDDQVVIGVLDIDSVARNTFDLEDSTGLQRICQVLATGCDWWDWE